MGSPLTDTATLAGRNAAVAIAFGKLTDDASLAVLDELGSTPVDSSGKPLVEHRVATIRVDTFGYEYTVKKIED